MGRTAEEQHWVGANPLLRQHLLDAADRYDDGKTRQQLNADTENMLRGRPVRTRLGRRKLPLLTHAIRHVTLQRLREDSRAGRGPCQIKKDPETRLLLLLLLLLLSQAQDEGSHHGCPSVWD